MSPATGGSRLVVFTKPPVAGRAKTRLAPRVGLDGAARLHRAFLTDTLETAAKVEAELVVAWAIGIEDEPPSGWLGRRRGQGDGDLGARLARVMTEERPVGGAVVVIGSDHPEFRAEAVERAFEHLRCGTDVVLGPTADGGYWLVGGAARVDFDALFADTPWSTATVREVTRNRCHELDLAVAEVAATDDIDTPEDLDRLLVRLAALPSDRCPATREALEHLGQAVS